MEVSSGHVQVFIRYLDLTYDKELSYVVDSSTVCRRATVTTVKQNKRVWVPHQPTTQQLRSSACEAPQHKNSRQK